MAIPRLIVSLVLTSLLVSGSWAQYPAIDDEEGFEVDMEPFYVDYQDGNASSALDDLQDYLSNQMRADMPNLMGILLYPYDSDEHHSRFYTGITVFRGPPFRTNYDVYLSQQTTMKSFRTVSPTATAIMGVPEWFDPTTMGSHTEDLMEQNVQVDPQQQQDNGYYGDDAWSRTYYNYYSADHVLSGILGALVGSMVGSCLMIATMYCLCFRRCMRNSVSINHNNKANTSRGDGLFRDEVDDDDDDEDDPFEPTAMTKSPKRNQRRNNNNNNNYRDDDDDEEANHKSIQRRPSHHRRWNSHQVPPQATFDFFDTDEADEPNSNHQNNNNHRRSSSVGVAEAYEQIFGNRGRTASMSELLAGYDE